MDQFDERMTNCPAMPGSFLEDEMLTSGKEEEILQQLIEIVDTLDMNELGTRFHSMRMF